MRVATNTVDSNIISQIQQLSAQQVQLQNEVSTGLRITNPSDDPAAYSRVLSDNSQSSAIAQYGSNASAALAVNQATVSSLTQVKSIADRASQVGILGAGTIGPSAMNAYASEVNQLIEQTVQLGNGKFNNNYLFSGTAVTTAPYSVSRDAQGNITSVSYSGNASQSSIPISSTANIAPGSDSTTNQGLTTFMNNLVALRDALNSGNTAAVSTAQTSLLSTENAVINGISELGAVQMRIQINQDQQTSLSQTLGKLVSDETGADLPSTVVKLTQAQNAYQAAIQSAASIMQKSILTYLPVA